MPIGGLGCPLHCNPKCSRGPKSKYIDDGGKGTSGRVNGGPEKHEAIAAFIVDGLALVGGVYVVENRVWHTELV